MGVFNHGIFISAGLLGLSLCSTLFAHPAAPDAPKTVKNADGSEVTLQFYGDEHYHYATTQDGYLVVSDSGSFVYADEDGKPTKVKARNEHKRTEKEQKFLKGLDRQKSKKMHRARHVDKYPEESAEVDSLGPVALRKAPAALNRPTPQRWVVGERWIPVLLIGTTDKPYADSAEVYAMLNQEGYNKEGNIGSLRDYYLFSSGGKFSPHFDVYPLQLNVPLTSFGNGDSYSEGNFTKAGVNALTARKDFQQNASKYCSSGTAVDGFIFLFPGKEVDALKQSEKFWGHQYWMQYNGAGSSWSKGYTSQGYTFNTYLFIAQYDDYPQSRTLTAMGVFAHEFSHVLGLADLYSVSNSSIKGPSPYDVMTTGMYNGNWQTPPSFSAFERESMGWLTLEELSQNKVYSLGPLSQMQAYSVTNPNSKDEYYVVEYRPAEKYDAYIGQNKNGIYLWYIDYDYTAFETDNDPNKNVLHQRVAVKQVMGSDNSYYTDFSYTNAGGTALIPGIYNLKILKGKQACFATGANLSVDCQLRSSSSSQVALSSSSLVVQSSSSQIAQSSSSLSAPSSSSQLAQSSSSSESLRITNPLYWDSQTGVKTVKVFDLQGNRVYMGQVDGVLSAFHLEGILPAGAYVMHVSRNNRTLGIRKIRIP